MVLGTKREIEMVMVVAMEKQDKLQAVWFAAGMAALMACLERAILVSFVEQWRLIAFLALNLLLLAILFTSTTTTTILEITQPTISTNTTTESKIVEKMGKECKKPLVPCVEEISEAAITKDVKKEYTTIDKREEELLDDSVDEAQQISMEELNERAEAFIAMFRQHLISDAKADSYSKSCRIRTSISRKGGDKNFTKPRPIY